MLTKRLVAAALVIALGGSAAMADPATRSDRTLLGNWGGDRLNLTLGADGGTIESDCATGHIDGPVHPDARGRFSVTGQYERFQPGPQRADEAASASTARFDGIVKGTTLQLTVHPAGGQAAAKFALTSGRQIKLVRCF